MKRAGIMLILAALLLSSCVTIRSAKEMVPEAINQVAETNKSTEALEDKQLKVPDQVSDTVNEKVNDAVNEKAAESSEEFFAADSNQPKQDSQLSKSDSKSETAAVSSQAVDSDSSEARESDEESKAVSHQEDHSSEEAKETTAPEESPEEKTVVEEAESSSVTESEAEKQTEVTDVTEESETEAESKVEPELEEESVQESEPESEPEPAFDIDYWIAYAKQCAVDHGLNLDSTATDCWDNPITANASCIYLERDLNARMNRYASIEDVTDVWIWYEDLGNERYLIYIGYA